MVGVDFVGPLPESKTLHGTFDMILVAIDHLTAMVHLAPTKQTYRAKDVAEVMFNLVYKLHGMPSRIVSDRDTLFTSTFWQKLNELTGTELRMSTSFHPQTDGITERANRTITQMLRQCVTPDQRDWAIKLPAIEFAINSASSASRKEPPFVLIYGRQPPSMIWNAQSEYPGVHVFAQRMKDAIMGAHDALIAARVKSTALSNRKRKEAPFAKGDLVYLSTENLSLPKGRARKLAPKFIGPFKILEDYRNNSYLLDLPSDLKQRGLHPAFHAHLLRIHIPNDDRRFPGRQLNQVADLGSLEEWSVSRVVSHNGQGTDSLFEIEYTTGDRVWLPYHEVSRLEAVGQYLEALGVPSIQHLPRKISTTSPEISAANIGLSLDAGNIVFDVVDRLINDLSGRSINTAAHSTNKRQEKVPTFYPACSSPAPASMPSSPSLAPVDQMAVDDSPVSDNPGEATCHLRHPRTSHGSSPHRGRKRGWRGGRGNPSQQREPNNEALSAFTCCFRAEAQASTMPRLPPSSRRTKYPAEELAVRKEAHAFSQQVKAEHERRYEPRPAPPSRRAPNLSLDNRDRRRERSTHVRAPRPRSAPTSVAPATARQIIAAASSTAAQIPPVVASAPAPYYDDTDVLQLIASSERDDLNREPQLRSEFLGRSLVACLLLINMLTLIAIVVALGAMQVSHDSMSSATSPAPSA